MQIKDEDRLNNDSISLSIPSDGDSSDTPPPIPPMTLPSACFQLNIVSKKEKNKGKYSSHSSKAARGQTYESETVIKPSKRIATMFLKRYVIGKVKDVCDPVIKQALREIKMRPRKMEVIYDGTSVLTVRYRP